MGIFEWNIVGLVCGFVAAIIGLLPGDKWNGKWFTPAGHLLLISITLTTISQVYIQLINSDEKEKIKSVISESLSGWIKIGTFESSEGGGTWVYKNLPGLDNLKPEDIGVKSNFIIGTGENYFINVRYTPPDRCNPPITWFNDKSNIKNVMSKNTLVTVRKTKLLKCPNEKVEVWSLVGPEMI